MFVLWTAAALLGVALGAADAWADDGAKSIEQYSALECLQQAAQAVNHPIDMLTLITSPHWEAEQSDFASQLANLANEQNLHALVLDHLRTEQIMDCPFPLILHVKGGHYSARPDYFVLCEQVRDKEAKVFVPSQGELSIPLSQLEDGRQSEVIAISDAPISINALNRPALIIARYGMMAGVLLGLVGYALARYMRQPRRTVPEPTLSKLGGMATEVPLLAGLAVVLAFTCRLAAGETLIPLDPADPAHLIDFLLPHKSDIATTATKPPEVSVEDALRLLASDALFVDARDLGEYDTGHIRGAILCPASDIGRWHLHMAGVDPNRKIVVYCAEATCGKGEYVATFLLQNGFTDVCLYRDGWAKWTGPREAK